LIHAREQRANIAWLLGDGPGDDIRDAFTASAQIAPMIGLALRGHLASPSCG
jgi:hypothetical protein